MNVRAMETGTIYENKGVQMVVIETQPGYKSGIIVKGVLVEYLVTRGLSLAAFKNKLGLNNRVIKASMTYWGMATVNFFKERYRDTQHYPHLLLQQFGDSSNKRLILDKEYFENYWVNHNILSVNQFGAISGLPSKVIKNTMRYWGVDIKGLTSQVRENEFGLPSREQSRVTELLSTLADPRGFFTPLKEVYSEIGTNPQLVADELEKLSRELLHYRNSFTEIAGLLRMRVRSKGIIVRVYSNLLEGEVANILDSIGVNYKYQYHLPDSKLEYDFYIPEHCLLLEIDGGAHQSHRDKEKEELAEDTGYSFVRVPFNKGVNKQKYRDSLRKIIIEIFTN